MTDERTRTQLYAVIEASEAAHRAATAALSAAEFCLPADRGPGRRHARCGGRAPAGRGGAEGERGGANRRGRPARAHAARRRRAPERHQGIGRRLRASARSILGPGGIVGVDPGISRHDAMTLAEAGADYIAFGAPIHLKDRDKARDAARRADRLVGGDLPGALRRPRCRDARGSRRAEPGGRRLHCHQPARRSDAGGNA